MNGWIFISACAVVLTLVGNAANVGFLVWLDTLELAALWVVVQMVTLHFIIHTRTRRVAAE